MARERGRKAVKVGVHEGGGLPPGYRWSLLILDQAYVESMSFLDGDQYGHLARQFQVLARQDEATRSRTVDVRPIEDYYELRDKGGVLGRINVRVFYCVDHDARNVVVLGAINKKNDGPTHMADKITMRRRMRLYFERLRPRQ